MSLKTVTRCLIAIGCVSVVPLYAQTTTTGTTSTTTTTHKVEHKAKTEAKETKAEEKKETKATQKKEMKAEEKKETKAEEKKETRAEEKQMKAEKAEKKAPHHMTHAMPMHGSRVYMDATRLAAVLADTQAKVEVSPAVWKTVANESNTLANRMAAGAKGKTRTEAMDARKHVREMHAAALKGDAAAARTHAAEALPYIYKVIDATAPAGMANSHM